MRVRCRDWYFTPDGSRPMRHFWVALQFLTRLPVPRSTSASPEVRGRSVPFYPLVGLLLGTLIAGWQSLLTGAEVGLQSALVLLAWVLLTGGLHLDGLADSADAWAGSNGDRTKALRIMKDAASGPAGVTAVTLILLIKFAALSVLINESLWPGLIVAPVLGRMAIVLLFLTTPYIRPKGLGAAQAAFLPRRLATVVLTIFATAIIGFGATGIWAMAAALGLVLLLRAMMIRRLGGATGDTLGAVCELVEAAVLVVTANLSRPVILIV
jgi:adenosylcobinamide-GDP ribazoletransferase